MEENPLRRPAVLLRAGLVLLVLALLFGPYELRAAVPLWTPVVILAALELHFFLGALRAAPPASRDRGPQAVDKELYGYPVLDDYEDEDEDEEEDDEEEPFDELEEPEPGRPRLRAARRLLAGLAVLGGLGLLLWVVDGRTGWDGLSAGTRAAATERFSAEASRIADKPVEIRCDESGERVGFVQHTDGVAIVGGELAYLTPQRCLDLYRLAFKDDVTGETGRAIAVLAHESWHLRGVGDEGTTECYALQSGVGLGRRLGLSEERARRLMVRQLAENAQRGAATFEYRVPPGCRDGGSLDLDPASSDFP